jgi:hypothetical protein
MPASAELAATVALFFKNSRREEEAITGLDDLRSLTIAVSGVGHLGSANEQVASTISCKELTLQAIFGQLYCKLNTVRHNNCCTCGPT